MKQGKCFCFLFIILFEVEIYIVFWPLDYMYLESALKTLERKIVSFMFTEEEWN